jgi:hypothetical protein
MAMGIHSQHLRRNHYVKRAILFLVLYYLLGVHLIVSYYSICGRKIQFSNQLHGLEFWKQPGAEEDHAPAIFSFSRKLISRSTGWVAGENRRVELWEAMGGYILQVSGSRNFHISTGGLSILLGEGSPKLTPIEQEVVLGPALTMALALGGKWCLHASAASFRDQGMVFLGESGFGKSTLSAYLSDMGKQNWQRVADDILPVTLEEGGITGWPHFPQLKLPPALQPYFSLPDKVLIDHIYLLSPDNSAATPTLKPLSKGETARVFLSNTAGSRLFPPSLLAEHLAFCAKAAEQVKGFRLSYPHQRDILPLVKDILEQNFKQNK